MNKRTIIWLLMAVMVLLLCVAVYAAPDAAGLILGIAAVLAVGAFVFLRKRQPGAAVKTEEGLCLLGLAGVYAGKRIALKGVTRIGRDPARNDLVFPVSTHGISGVHCILAVEDKGVWLKDVGSSYGTFLENGQRLAANEAVRLMIGEKFSLGSDREAFVITREGGI